MARNVFEGIDEYGESTALIDNGSAYSFTDLVAFGERLTPHLRSRSLVIVFCANAFEAVAGYVGLIRAGAVPLLVHATTKTEHLEQLVETFRPSHLYVPNELDFRDGRTVTSFGTYKLVSTGCVSAIDVHQDLALLLSTSGSTGSQMLVRLSHQNLIANTNSIVISLGIDAEDRAITTLPMSYTYGLSILNTHLAAGASAVLTENSLMTSAFWQQIETHGVTTFGGVPFTYEMLKKLRFADMALPSLRYLTQAGGKLSPEDCRQFMEIAAAKGMEFIVMYGQTEATARMAYLPWADALEKAGAIGIPVPGGRMWLEADDGTVIRTTNTPGELMYEGPNVSMGYATTAADLSLGDENGGILATGDIAEMDDDGYFTIVGRKKRFLKVFGHRINIDEIEQHVRAAGIDCACSGSDDALRVFVAEGVDIDKVTRSILAFANISRKGFEVRQIDSIPRNASGKISYPALDAMDGEVAHA